MLFGEVEKGFFFKYTFQTLKFKKKKKHERNRENIA